MSEEVAAGERGVIRVYRIDGDAPDVMAIQKALGARVLDSDGIEVFAASDLSGIGLSGYLVEGQGVSPEAIAPRRDTLDATEGTIVVVRSAAFGGRATRLDPGPPLQHLGTFREAAAETPTIDLTSRSAQGTVSPEAGQGAERRFNGKWLLIVLALLVAIVVAVVLFGGR